MLVDVKRLRELETLATPGPWEAEELTAWGMPMGMSTLRIGGEAAPVHDHDAILIAEIRNALPGLLDEVDRLRAVVAYARHRPFCRVSRIVGCERGNDAQHLRICLCFRRSNVNEFEPGQEPGSEGARARNCNCPLIDNHHGRGRYGDGAKFGWFVRTTCPLHGDASDR